MTMSDVLLNSITKTYNKGKVLAVDQVSFEVGMVNCSG